MGENGNIREILTEIQDLKNERARWLDVLGQGKGDDVWKIRVNNRLGQIEDELKRLKAELRIYLPQASLEALNAEEP